ncbi:hypothetical protein FRC16_002456, partial [Serendipita sp. 398]
MYSAHLLFHLLLLSYVGAAPMHQTTGQNQDNLAVPPTGVGSSSSPEGVHSQEASEVDHEDEEGNVHSKGGIPQVTRDILKAACADIKKEIFPVNHEWQNEFGPDSYLNECGITERAALAMLKHKAAGITLVSQRQEGRMGCDLIVQMLVPKDIHEAGLANLLVKKLKLDDTPSPRVVPEPVDRPKRVKTGNTPVVSTPGTGTNTPFKKGVVKSPTVRQLTAEEIPAGFTVLTAYLQAKWYKHMNKRDDKAKPIRTRLQAGQVREKEFVADFTYTGTGARTTQLETLDAYVKKRQAIDKNTMGAYLLYGGEKDDITLALLDDVVSECKKHNGGRPCERQESEINTLMSRRFHEEGKSQECFLEHLAEATGLFGVP